MRHAVFGVRPGLRTLPLVPLSPCTGVEEYVQQTEAVGELPTSNTTPAEGAHHRYRQEAATL